MTTPLRIYTRQDLVEHGIREGAIRTAVKDKALVRVRAGRYANGEAWRALYVEGRQRVMAEAAAAAAKTPPIFCGVTAVAAHELPLYRVKDAQVHVLARAERAAGKSASVMRHEVPFTDDDLVERDGLVITSVDRTVFDVIRQLPYEAGVALADAALRAADDADELRDRIAVRIDRASGARGIQKARTVLGFADENAESPGESGSRWFMHLLGFRDVRIQEPFAGPHGEDWRIDFRMRRAWGEFDGQAKYSDPEFLKGRTPEQARRDEKRREDYVRGRSQLPFVRWTDRDMPTAVALGAHFAGYGVIPPG